MFQVNNEHFYENINGYYQLIYPTPGRTPSRSRVSTLQQVIVFNKNGIGEASIDNSLCDINNEHEICDGMYDIFLFLSLRTKRTNVLCFLLS